MKPSAVVLAGLLGVGLLPVANAKVLWVEADKTGKYYCPDVCQVTKHFHPKHSEYNVPYAVPSGVYAKPGTKIVGKKFYVCAANIYGWVVGVNPEFISHRCYTTAFTPGHGINGIYREYYYCLCSNTPIEPIKD